MKTASDFPSSRRAGLVCPERGFSLIVTLILLVIVTVLSIAASQMVLLSERSTRFDRDRQIAFQAAEAALLDAEFDIRGPNTAGSQRVGSFAKTSQLGFVEGCGTGADRGKCLRAADGQPPVWLSVDFTDQSAASKTVGFGEFTGRILSTGSTGIRPEQPPRYLIEAIEDNTPGQAGQFQYRVTAMGFGPRKETQAVVQMIFKKE